MHFTFYFGVIPVLFFVNFIYCSIFIFKFWNLWNVRVHLKHLSFLCCFCISTLNAVDLCSSVDIAAKKPASLIVYTSAVHSAAFISHVSADSSTALGPFHFSSWLTYKMTSGSQIWMWNTISASISQDTSHPFSASTSAGTSDAFKFCKSCLNCKVITHKVSPASVWGPAVRPARPALAGPDTGLSGISSAELPAGSWSRWSGACVPSLASRWPA